jgi:hypothetical protein
LPFDFDALLPLTECLKPRTPKELRAWVLARCDAFAQIPELRKPVLLHEGLFKWFHEEIYPLSVFAARRYGDRADVLCVPKRDQTSDVDAEIYEPSRINVQITGARHPGQHVLMRYFVDHPVVELLGDRESYLGWIKTAAQGKSGRGRYGKGYELLISVEDFWFDAERDIPEVTSFIEPEVLRLPLEFAALHLVGLTEKLFLSFPILAGDRPL